MTENETNAKTPTRVGKSHSKKKTSNKSPTSVASLNSDTAVPMLRLGVNSNFDMFKKKMSIACMERYKNLGRLIHDENYCAPPVIDVNDFNLANNTRHRKDSPQGSIQEERQRSGRYADR